jgi:hypothetical protein
LVSRRAQKGRRAAIEAKIAELQGRLAKLDRVGDPPDEVSGNG